MNKGMLWFDNNPKTTLAEKVAEAVEYYRTKYGQAPNLCMVNPSMLGEETKIDGVMVKSYRPVLPGHLWIGMAEHVSADQMRRTIGAVEAL